jgi:BNR repeat-containing family member
MQFGQLGAIFGELGASGSGGGVPPIITEPFTNDGSSAPWFETAIGPNSVHVTATNTTWYTWEGYQTIAGTAQRTIEVATYNHTTATWSGNYIVGIRTINDVHEVPAIAANSDGRIIVGYGCHNSAVQFTVTDNVNDPTSWTDGYSITGAHTFTNLIQLGTTVYFFYSSTGAGVGAQEAIYVVPITFTGSVPSFGSAVKLFDSATAGNDGWLPLGTFALSPDGTKIHMVFTYGVTVGAAPDAGIYYGVFNPADLTTMGNYAGTTFAVPVSLPDYCGDL